jgi:hypothetical protein
LGKKYAKGENVNKKEEEGRNKKKFYFWKNVCDHFIPNCFIPDHFDKNPKNKKKPAYSKK